jgi:mercuric ion transport protein
MRQVLFAGGGLLAAVAASTCCVLPLSLGAVGLGGVWLSTLTALAPYETAFRMLAILLLGAGFWFAYSRRAAADDAAACPTVPSERITKTLLWAGAVVMVLVLSAGWWGQLIV